jgi:hypothetical protein
MMMIIDDYDDDDFGGDDDYDHDDFDDGNDDDYVVCLMMIDDNDDDDSGGDDDYDDDDFDDGNGDDVVCYFWSVVAPGQPCSRLGQCVVHAECSPPEGGTCNCKKGYFAKEVTQVFFFNTVNLDMVHWTLNKKIKFKFKP